MPALMSSAQKKEVLTLDVSSPFDRSLIRTIPMQSADDAEAMLEKALACYRNRDGWLEHHERIAILEKLAISIDAEADDFALLIAQEGGKPLGTPALRCDDPCFLLRRMNLNP